MTDLIILFERSVEEFGRRVRLVADDQWKSPTPDDDWDVRALVHHLASEAAWAPPLLAGATIEEVGDRFDGDLLGDDPRAAWDAFALAALEAAKAGGEDSLGRTVHVSFGEITAAEYLSQMTGDHTVHAWDLARAIGADEELDPELVEFAIAAFSPDIDQWRQAGIFGPEVTVAAGADRQSQLLALTGRTP